MSIANLYGPTRDNLAFIDPALESKVYIPGGVMLSSTIFAPAAGVNAAQRIKLLYTKIGNQVTISCRVYTAATGAGTTHFVGAAAVGQFSAANLGVDITAQLNNDLLVKDNNPAGLRVGQEIRVPGLFVNGTGAGAYAMAVLTPNQIEFGDTPGLGNLTAAAQYFPGSISFLAQNAAIVV